MKRLVAAVVVLTVALVLALSHQLSKALTSRADAELRLAECRAAHESLARALEEQRAALDDLKAQLAESEDAARRALNARDAAIARARAVRTSRPSDVTHTCEQERIPAGTAEWLAQVARASG